MKHIGITGSKDGISAKQRHSLEVLLTLLYLCIEDPELHHGDCVGADEEAFLIAVRIGFAGVVHPPIDERYRAFTDRAFPQEIRPAKGFLARNLDIARECQLLIVIPNSYEEKLRSGTWATMRYAKRYHKPIIVIWPDGSIEWS